MIKKQLIMEKSLELFAKQGFGATSVQQITEHCGISKGAFYLSFKSKDELILSIIDHFMREITSQIDYIVKTTEDENVLYAFYYESIQSFNKHSDFAKIFIKEQAHSLNEELFLKLHSYDKLMEKTILTMVERLYGDSVKDTKYDVMYSIRSFINMYTHLFLLYHLPFDIQVLVQSLVEKTNLIAKHSKIPFLTEEMMKFIQEPLNNVIEKEQLLESIEKLIVEMDDDLVKESLLLLKEQMNEQTFSTVIIKGLLKNIQYHPHCKWISYLLNKYFE